ncbi:non-ribosomal peptide synthetase/polyketide synthetase, partial [Pseudomonas amygdali pv. mori str. 301020]
MGEALQRRRSALAQVPLSALEQQLSELFVAVIGRDIELDQTFFEAGATSLGLMRLHARFNEQLPQPVAMAALFEHVTVRRLAQHLSASPSVSVARAQGSDAGEQPMAIIGMSVN